MIFAPKGIKVSTHYHARYSKKQAALILGKK